MAELSDIKLPINNRKIGFIGGGNMAKALCTGIIKTGLYSNSDIYVSSPHLESLQYWKEQGANVTTKNNEVISKVDVVFLTVKPHQLQTAVISCFLTPETRSKDQLFISVLAGTKIDQLEKVLSSGCKIIRCMPNTPISVGAGCIAYSCNSKVTGDDINFVKLILSKTGICRNIPENMINAVGALAGSGPAFVFLIIEALSDGGVKMGMPRQMATEFASQMVLGSAKMVQETGKHPGELKDEVCSAGGTTITGIHALERGGVRGSIMDAIECATKRAEEMQK